MNFFFKFKTTHLSINQLIIVDYSKLELFDFNKFVNLVFNKLFSS